MITKNDLNDLHKNKIVIKIEYHSFKTKLPKLTKFVSFLKVAWTTEHRFISIIMSLNVWSDDSFEK